MINTPEEIASQVAGIVHSTRYVSSEWEALEDDKRKQIITQWANLIRADPCHAADQIVEDILARPGLGDAWRKVGETSSTTYRPASIVHLVSLYPKCKPT